MPSGTREKRTRFIPAPAGNGPVPGRGHPGRAVYPRACGERRSAAQNQDRKGGLSPRLRGTAQATKTVHDHRRFIPAPAGNGPSIARLHTSTAVYPRACGERFTVCGDAPCELRFIPAPAGNGSDFRHQLQESAVYPRACGERMSADSRVVSPCGLSPRLRGTEGFSRASPDIQTVYPRACGERCHLVGKEMEFRGLSPRLRGTVIQPLTSV